MKFWRKLLWLGALAGVSTALMVVLPASEADSKPDGTVTILATTATNGEIAPCG